VSKAEKDKRVVDVTQEPLLQEMDMPGLFKAYKHAATKEAEYKHRKSSITDDIKECMSSVDADIVTYTDTHGGDWHANLIKPEPRLALVEDKLRENLGKLGKLDALLIARILLASKVPMPHEPYVRVYPPGTKNGD